jgi:hypothetical protein
MIHKCCRLGKLFITCPIRTAEIFKTPPIHIFNIFEKNSMFVCLFILSRTSNFSAIWRLSRLPATGLWLALTAFSSESSFTCHTYCDMGPPFLRSYPERPVILPSECRALSEGAITTYFKRFRFDAVGPSGARTHDLPFAKREHYH